MQSPHGQPVKYDDTCTLEFTRNTLSQSEQGEGGGGGSGWNITGKGQNRFGTYRVSGTVTTNAKGFLDLELFRLFDHLINPKVGKDLLSPLVLYLFSTPMYTQHNSRNLHTFVGFIL